MFDPGGGGFGEAGLGGGELFDEPVWFVAGLRFAFVERLSRVAYGDLRLLECGAQLDRSLVLRDWRLERTRAAIVVALSLAVASSLVAPGAVVAGAARTIVSAVPAGASAVASAGVSGASAVAGAIWLRRAADGRWAGRRPGRAFAADGAPIVAAGGAIWLGATLQIGAIGGLSLGRLLVLLRAGLLRWATAAAAPATAPS